jgi:hypothetical protein
LHESVARPKLTERHWIERYIHHLETRPVVQSATYLNNNESPIVDTVTEKLLPTVAQVGATLLTI